MIGLGWMSVFIQIYPAYISSSVSEESTNENKEEDKSIAVLPFDNLSADEENQYFADGQMEAILNHLTRIADLRVISRTTMMGYRGKTKNIPDIARELGVRYVLEGSVQKAGEKVRITAQLIDAESDEHLWSDNYDRDLADIFGIQTEIAKKVVQELKMTISSREQINIESTPTSDLTAYDFYLRGMDFESRGNRKEDLQFALQMYKHAVELDKNYTLAWVSLASTSRSMYWFYRDRSSTRLEKTKEYLDKALELEPDLLEVQIETGRYYYQCQLNYQKALGIFEPLLTSYPKNDQLNFWTGAVYRRKGEFEKAFELMDRAIKLNPSEWDHWQNAAGTLVYRKKYKQAESFYRIAMDLNPLSVSPQLTHLYLNVGEVTKARNFADNNNRKTLGWFRVKANVELFDRNYKKAISILESSSETIESHQSWLIPKSLSLGMIYRLMPDVESAARYFQEAKKMLEELIIEDPEDFRILGSLGIVYAGLGMREEALEAGNKALSIMNLSVDAMKGYRRELELAMIWLMIGEYDQAISKLDFLIQQNGSRSVEYLKLDPFWDPIRDMDAFKALINNPAYQVDWNE
jgi:serine/threonine-protein kinase